MALQAKPLVSHWLPIWAPVCGSANPFSTQLPANGLGKEQKEAQILDPCIQHGRDWEEAPASLLISSAPTSTAIWGVNQQRKIFLSHLLSQTE